MKKTLEALASYKINTMAKFRKRRGYPRKRSSGKSRARRKIRNATSSRGGIRM